jgi:hypothetical protein
MKPSLPLLLLLLLWMPCPAALRAQHTYRVGTSVVSIEPDASVASLPLAGYGYPRDGRFTLKWVAQDGDADALQGSAASSLQSSSVVWASAGETTTADRNGRIYRLHPDLTLWARIGAEWFKIGYPNGVTYAVTPVRIAVCDGSLYAADADNRLYRAVHSSMHELSARSMAITSGKQTVVIVALDLTGFDYSLALDVKRVIRQKHGIPPEAIFINASHTHFAPVAQWFPTWGRHQQLPDSAYFNRRIKQGIITSIEEALANRTRATLSFGRGNTAIGANRSLVGEDARYDSAVDVLRVKDALLFIAACHPVFRNDGVEGFTISPNFPGFARNAIERRAPVKQALFLQGCAGDVNPLTDNAAVTGYQLADDVLSIPADRFTQLSGGISFALDSVMIPVNVWSRSRIEQFKADHSGHPGNVEDEKNVRWAEMMLDCYDRNAVPRYLPVYVQTINIGQWKLVGLSREAVSAYALAIRRLWADRFVSVTGYTNAVPGYLPNAAHIRNQTYEGYNSFFWNAQPALFPENVFDTIMKAIKQNNR